MTEIIAIANQKGGVGKTTSAVSIGAELSLAGARVLLIDFDPQCNATSGVGAEIPERDFDLFDVFLGKTSLDQILVSTQVDGLTLAPSSRDLVGIEIELGKTPGRELILKTGIRELANRFDYILIDCPPSSGLLTLNALGAAKQILIPLQSEYYALEGLSALMDTLGFVKQTFNPELRILGVFITMFDSRTNLSSMVEGEAREFFKALMFNTRIPRSVKLSEAPSHGLPIALYDSFSPGALAYRNLTQEIVLRLQNTEMPTTRKIANL